LDDVVSRQGLGMVLTPGRLPKPDWLASEAPKIGYASLAPKVQCTPAHGNVLGVLRSQIQKSHLHAESVRQILIAQHKNIVRHVTVR
jgi:hypothetical protein